MLQLIPQPRRIADEKLALQILEDYQQVGAVQEVSPLQSKYWVPWFVIKKKEEDGKEKLRLIADCRVLNQGLQTRRFTLDHWQKIFPLLRKGMWATKVDLKNAYFHLALSEKLRPYVHLNVGGRIFQFNASCFGLSTLPQIWMDVMKVFEKRWRARGYLVFIYLDDILLVAKNKKLLEKQTICVQKDLQDAGMQINYDKSILQPTQKVKHLGFTINFEQGTLEVPPEKLRSIRRELGKLLTHQSFTPRKMAAILGVVRSFLTALPFLRAFTDQMVQFTSLAQTVGWDQKIPLPPPSKSNFEKSRKFCRPGKAERWREK
jgi:hypothetical protein